MNVVLPNTYVDLTAWIINRKNWWLMTFFLGRYVTKTRQTRGHFNGFWQSLPDLLVAMSLSVTSRFLAQTANTFVYWPHTKYVITMWPQSHVKNSSESVGMCRAQIQVQPLLWQLKKLGQTLHYLTQQWLVSTRLSNFFSLFQPSAKTHQAPSVPNGSGNSMEMNGLRGGGVLSSPAGWATN